MKILKLTYFSSRTMNSITFLLICLSLFGCGNGEKIAIASSENEMSYPVPEQNEQAPPAQEEIVKHCSITMQHKTPLSPKTMLVQ